MPPLVVRLRARSSSINGYGWIVPVEREIGLMKKKRMWGAELRRVATGTFWWSSVVAWGRFKVKRRRIVLQPIVLEKRENCTMMIDNVHFKHNDVILTLRKLRK